MKKTQSKPELKTGPKPEKVKRFSSTQKMNTIKEYETILEEDKEHPEEKKENLLGKKVNDNGHQLEVIYTQENLSSLSESEKKEETIKKPTHQIHNNRSNICF
jgi:hypothetical protein